MTPVQLPEVPARYDTAHSENTGETLAVYTAAQLREYAIQAVRQAANAIFAEGWYLACDWLERDDLKFDVDSPAFAADRAARLAALLTLLENNSDR